MCILGLMGTATPPFLFCRPWTSEKRVLQLGFAGCWLEGTMMPAHWTSPAGRFMHAIQSTLEDGQPGKMEVVTFCTGVSHRAKRERSASNLFGRAVPSSTICRELSDLKVWPVCLRIWSCGRPLQLGSLDRTNNYMQGREGGSNSKQLSLHSTPLPWYILRDPLQAQATGRVSPTWNRLMPMSLLFLLLLLSCRFPSKGEKWNLPYGRVTGKSDHRRKHLPILNNRIVHFCQVKIR